VELLQPLNKSVYLPILLLSTLKVSEVESCLLFPQPQTVARTLLERLLGVGEVPNAGPKQPGGSQIPAGLPVPLAEGDASRTGT